MGQLKLYSDRMAGRYEEQQAATESAQSARDDGLVSWRSHHAAAKMAGEVEVIHGD